MTKRGNPRKPTKRGKLTQLTAAQPSDPIDQEFRSMMSATRNRCGTCRCFRLTPSKETGECRADLPQADLEDGGRAVWPHGIDPDTGWCINWESL